MVASRLPSNHKRVAPFRTNLERLPVAFLEQILPL